jgi:hypothetical protein
MTNPARRPVLQASQAPLAQTGIDRRADVDDAARQGIGLSTRELAVAPQRRLYLIGDARDDDCAHCPRSALQGMGGIDAAGELAIAGNNRQQLLALLPKQGENIPLELQIAEGLPRKMLCIEHLWTWIDLAIDRRRR